MRRIICGFCLIAAIALTPLGVGAASYHDPMRETAADAARSCQGLRPSQRAGLPDPDYLTFQNSSPQGGGAFGWVTYQVTGAERVTVGIYTHAGSFYLYNDQDYPAAPGYILGMVNPERVLEPGQSRPSIGLSPEGRYALYAEIGELRHRLFYRRIEHVRSPPRMFLPEPAGTQAPIGLRPYALAVWSSDGTREAAVPMARTSAIYCDGLNYCYEEFQGTVTQQGARQLRVEINDVTSVPWSDGEGMVNISSYQLTALASVLITGDRLLMGPAEEVRPPEQDPDPPESKEPSSRPGSKGDGGSKSSHKVPASQGASSSQSSSAGSAAPSSASSTGKEASSPKFQGSVAIFSNTSSEKSSSEKSSAPPREKAKTIAESAPPLEVEAVPALYQPAPEQDRRTDPFAWAVAAYLAAVSAAILFVIVRSYHKR